MIEDDNHVSHVEYMPSVLSNRKYVGLCTE